MAAVVLTYEYEMWTFESLRNWMRNPKQVWYKEDYIELILQIVGTSEDGLAK